MDVRMPVQEFAVSLNRRNHAGHHILAAEQPLRFRLQTRPGTGREFTQKLAIESRVNSQTPGDGQHDLSVGDRRADLFGYVQRGQQRPLLLVRGARAVLLAGEGDEHLMLTVGAANSCDAFL